MVQLVGRNEGDLVAKFYFAKRQLVWEILRNGLKEKIEIEWSNIIGIQAFMEENKPGILEVEVRTNNDGYFVKNFNKSERSYPSTHTNICLQFVPLCFISILQLHHPPKFYKEIEPEPRKHTQWTDGSDFTEGQASINRFSLEFFLVRFSNNNHMRSKF